ncbi:MAG: ATP-binding protein [Bradyrhizobium sp.]
MTLGLVHESAYPPHADAGVASLVALLRRELADERDARVAEQVAAKAVRHELDEVRGHLRKLTSLHEEQVRRRTGDMRRALDEALSASSAKSAFLANMSHEIRTPLTSIIGFAELMLEPDSNAVNAPEALQTIIRNGRHLLDVINDILDLAKIEMRQVDVENIEVPVPRLLRDIKTLVASRAAERSLELKVVPHFPLPAVLHSDPVRLKQILLNLCSNAIKFTPKGSVTLELHYSAAHRRMVFRIVDTGIGMSPEQLSKLFQPFVQADTSTTRKFGGSGLGLTISQQLATLIGGRIRVQSRLGRGSRFDLQLDLPDSARDVPLLLANEDLIPQTRPDFTVTQIVVPDLSGRVLLAEDGVDNQRLLNAFLKRAGLSATIVNNGREAVEAALRDSFDLILMDVQMPEMDGVSATRKLREEGYRGPIVALTANVMKADIERCRAAGCDEVLAKPVDRERFYEVLMQFTSAQMEVWQQAADPIDDPEYCAELEALAAEFRAGLPGQIDTVRASLDQSDWPRLKSLIHNLKGTAGSYGYPKLTEMAAAVDAELFAGNYTRAIERCESLMEQARAVVCATG